MDDPITEKARMLIRNARNKSAKIVGDGPAITSLREFYDGIASRIEAALVLRNGPISARSQHWQSKLPKILDEAIEQLNGRRTEGDK